MAPIGDKTGSVLLGSIMIQGATSAILISEFIFMQHADAIIQLSITATFTCAPDISETLNKSRGGEDGSS